MCYFGEVSYAERALAIDDAAAARVIVDGCRLLVDFSCASVVERPDGERMDYIAKAITHPGLAHCKVALLDLSHADAQAAETVGIMRRIQIRRFAHRDEAIRWLLAT